MSSVLLLCFLIMLPSQLEVIHLALPLESRPLVEPYRNSNFSQNTVMENDGLICHIETRDYRPLARHFRIIPDPDFIEQLPPATADLARQLLAGSSNLNEYIRSCSNYLEKHIRYDEAMSSADPEVIIRSGTANCIGYCSLFGLFLKAGSIQSRVSRGFFLSNEKNGRIRLIPHRWLEITLSKTERIFFDPQYQSFRASYIKTDDQIQFTKIKAFEGRLIKRSQRLSDQEEP